MCWQIAHPALLCAAVQGQALTQQDIRRGQHVQRFEMLLHALQVKKPKAAKPAAAAAPAEGAAPAAEKPKVPILLLRLPDALYSVLSVSFVSVAR